MMHLFDEMADHLFGLVEIGDHAVAQRAYRDDVTGRTSEHPFRLFANGEHGFGAAFDCDH